MTSPVQGDICPLCGTRGTYILYGASDQVMCVNDECGAFLWDASATLDEILSDIGTVSWTSTPPGSSHSCEDDVPGG
jgi:hypothetical protein